MPTTENHGAQEIKEAEGTYLYIVTLFFSWIYPIGSTMGEQRRKEKATVERGDKESVDPHMLHAPG